MKKIVMLILLTVTVYQLAAETLIGQISAAEDNSPLAGVSIYVRGQNLGTISDEKGNFIIRNLQPGTYKIDFTRLGYEPFVREINFPDEYSLQIRMKRKATLIEGMKISSSVAVERETPVTFSNMDKNEIAEANFGQDIPMLMNEMPNVFSYADAGSPMGYSNLKIRGFDQKRIGVMINGIPLNDPEDHQVYWIDMPDFAESVSEIQFQRGVGSSLYGVSTFGGSLNMRTNHANFKEGAEIFTNYGSYNTLKYGFNSTKNIMNYFKLNLRLSRITSDGYRDNSQTEQYSYFAGLSKTGERSVVEINLYGGNELTHAAWYASREDDLKENHQHNPITYNNEIDDFTQPHYELHHQYMINEKLSTDNSLFYISGKGYYEQYKDERDLWEYGLADSPETIETDLIRQKHVEKNQFGWVGSMNWQHRLGTLSLGSFISLFDSDHWGEITDVIGADTLGIQFSKGQKYYKYTGEKQYYTFYLNEIFKPFEKISIMTNLHYQLINYKFRQLPAGNFTGEFLNSYTVDYSFFNPRFGINYNINDECNIFSNLSFAHREPTDDELFDIWDGPDDLGVAPLFAEADTIFVNGEIDHIEWSKPYVKEEKLMDLEFGFGYDAGNWKLKTNIFRMNFQDEIVGYGTVDEDGNPIRGNADETVHQGVELEAEAEIWQHFKLSGSFSYNDNFFRKFIMKTWDENWNVINVDYSGNKIAGFPDVLAAAKLSYQWRDLFISLQLQHVGKQYLDNTENDERIVEPFRLMNLGINYEIAEFFDLAQIDLNLKIRNLLDKEYETSGYYDDWEGANYYFPGAGRNIIAGIRARF